MLWHFRAGVKATFGAFPAGVQFIAALRAIALADQFTPYRPTSDRPTVDRLKKGFTHHPTSLFAIIFPAPLPASCLWAIAQGCIHGHALVRA